MYVCEGKRGGSVCQHLPSNEMIIIMHMWKWKLGRKYTRCSHSALTKSTPSPHPFWIFFKFSLVFRYVYSTSNQQPAASQYSHWFFIRFVVARHVFCFGGKVVFFSLANEIRTNCADKKGAHTKQFRKLTRQNENLSLHEILLSLSVSLRREKRSAAKCETKHHGHHAFSSYHTITM